MATIVKFYKDGRNVKDITSIGYLPVDEDAVKDSRHLASSGSVIAAAALGEESMMANLPIADNTLRFSFGDLDYDPIEHLEGRAGSWTKKNTKFANVWDWTNTNTSWASAFADAFPDEDNPVNVIAAGDTSSVTDFSRLFQHSYGITEICPFDTSKATTTYCMFSQCYNISEFPDMDISNAVDVRAMYQNCAKMTTAPNLVLPENCNFLFGYCYGLTDISSLDTSNVTNMESMFQACTSLETIPLLNTSNVTNMKGMFAYCSSLKSVSLLDTSNVTNMGAMFRNCESLTEVPAFYTSKVTSFASMLSGIRYSGNEVVSITEMHILSVPNFDFASATRLDDFMGGNVDITEIPEMNIEADVTRCDKMFTHCPNVKSGQKALYDNLSAISTITNHTDCFQNCGIDTPEGRAELEQIPVSWGGTLEETP